MDTVNVVRDVARILVPLAIGGVYLYLVVAGAIDVDSFQDLAVPALALYIGLDGTARAVTRNSVAK